MKMKLQEICKSLVFEYNLLKSFCFTSSDVIDENENFVNQGDFTILMANRSGDCVRLKFCGVRNVEIRTGAFDEISVIGLIIEDMSNDQWPDVQLRVVSEDDLTYLSFYCVDADVEMVAPEIAKEAKS